MCPDSQIAKQINLARTKATCLTKNVAGNAHLIELTDQMRSQPFSLVIDESTDVAAKKNLVLVTRAAVWEKETLKVRDYFYHVLELAEADAITIHGAIKKKFDEDNIPYRENLLGFAADGANVMMGGSHSVATLLRNDCPDIFVLKCVCHSFALCASYACKKLPQSTENVCREIYFFLNSSPLRTAKFNELQTLLDLKPLKMLHPSATRWLSLEAVVRRMLDRFDALKLYFSFTDASADQRQVEKMAHINQALNDPLTKIVLTFLEFILPKVNSLNRLFQSETPQIFRLSEELDRLVRTLLSYFMDEEYLSKLKNLDDLCLEEGNYCDLKHMYVGVKTRKLLDELALDELKKPIGNVAHQFRVMAMNFYLSLVHQIRQRMNANDETLTSLKLIDPENIKQRKFPSLAPLLTRFPRIVDETEMQAADDEYRELRNLNWISTADVSDSVGFWGKVLSTRRTSGEYAFPTLKRFIPTMLSLPHSSATVERVFSAVNLNKTKLRNRMSNSSLEGILAAKEYAETHKGGKNQMVTVTNCAIKLFNSEMYANKADQ